MRDQTTSLTVSLTFAPKSVNEVAQALLGMFSEDVNARIAGARVLGWNATGLYLAHQYNADPVFPNIIFRWWAAPLDSGWRTRWQRLDNRMTFLETH